MEKTYLPFLVVAILPFFWLILVTGIMYLISFTGWRNLAKKYANQGENPQTGFHWASVQTSWIGRYNNCINLAITPRGLFVQPWLLFRFAHPGLLMPWNTLKHARPRSVLFWDFAELEFDDGTNSLLVFAPSRILQAPGFPRQS